MIMDKNEKTFFGITKVTGSLRSKRRYLEKDIYAQRETDQTVTGELESEQGDEPVYDFRGSYPVKRKCHRKTEDQS